MAGSTPSQSTSRKTSSRKKNKVFLIEKLIAERQAKDDSGSQYLVHWTGYPASHATWEPRQNIPAEVLQEWENRGGERSQEMIAAKEYHVDHIDAERRRPNGEYEYHVHWQGYPASSATWEPRKHINDEAFGAWLQSERARLDQELNEIEMDQQLDDLDFDNAETEVQEVGDVHDAEGVSPPGPLLRLSYEDRSRQTEQADAPRQADSCDSEGKPRANSISLAPLRVAHARSSINHEVVHISGGSPFDEGMTASDFDLFSQYQDPIDRANTIRGLMGEATP